MPALGPSFGIAPAGTCTWKARSSNADSSIPRLAGVDADAGESDPRRLLHHVAELPGQDEAVAALHRGRLDEEDVAAGPGHREPRRDARHRRALRGLLEEPLAAERVAHGVGS